MTRVTSSAILSMWKLIMIRMEMASLTWSRPSCRCQKAAVNGDYKAATIFEASPYVTGTTEERTLGGNWPQRRWKIRYGQAL